MIINAAASNVLPAQSSPQNALVYVLLLNWNNWQDTVGCVTSLQTLDYEDWKLIVLDNGSTNDSVQRIRERFPHIDVVELGRNLGFAGGCNAGIRVALERGAEYVWLLNSDTTVDRGALRAMVEKAHSDATIGAVGSTIYSMGDGQRIQVWGGGYVDFLLGRSRHFTAPVSDEELHFITGASLLVGRRALEELGLLDEGFFMYWEDADYCFRLRRAGWRLAVAGASRVWHKKQGSVGKKSALLDTYFNRSAARFFKRYAAVPLVPLWASVALRLAKRALAGDWDRVRAVWAGARRAKKPHDSCASVK